MRKQKGHVSENGYFSRPKNNIMAYAIQNNFSLNASYAVEIHFFVKLHEKQRHR